MTRNRKLELAIGKTKRMFEVGYSVTEIAAALDLPESTVRSYKEIIDKAELNRRNAEEES